MEPLEAAILRTVLYADVFDYPLTLDKIHHFLIAAEPVCLERTRTTLESSGCLNRLLDSQHGFVFLSGRGDLVTIRQAREAVSARLWPIAVGCGVWLARLPFVRMVALTGALAVRNVPDEDDDLDYLLVTAPGRVWLARAFAILLVRLARLRGVEICPNYVLAENALEQSRCDIFMAHEVAQMVPIYGHEVYRRMRGANHWSESYLPNAIGTFEIADEQPIGTIWMFAKRAIETALAGQLGNLIERWEYRRKLRRFQSALQNPNSSARIDETQVKGHFNDNGTITLEKYRERLRQYGVDDAGVSVAADQIRHEL